MTDRFEYASPFGSLGKLADWLFLVRYMMRFLKQRNDHLKSIAESDDHRRFLPDVSPVSCHYE